ncbi:MAG TPA: TonB-dependent receptor [Pyrinomonadaceae bacterium]|nr:TonB-dependent receptor [Pyrinomonadaceae bacterium]
MAMTFLLLALAPAASAQEGTAALRGTVLDPNGAAVPGAQVSIANQETGLNRRTSTTGEDGEYAFTSLTPGLYRITVEAANFKRVVKEGVKLNVGEEQEFKVNLEIGGAAETVTVTSDNPIVQTTSKEIGGHIGQEELTELPSINRNFIGFVGLLPGVVPNISTESFGSDSVSVNGQDPRFNNYLLDGSNNNDDVIGQRAGSQARTALEAVQEFQVLTNQFDAEYGRTSGGIINAITKSGTNDFHGSVFGFFQDNSLNAVSRFAQLNQLEDPEASYKQFGGTIGGPIKRNLAHFFFSYERTNIDEGIVVDIPAAPSLNATTTEQTRADNTILRFDMQPEMNHQVAVRWLREKSPQLNQIITAFARPVSLEASREEADIDQTIVGSWTYTLTPTLLNDLRLSFTREDVAFANPGFNSGKSMAELPPTLVFNSFVTQQSNVAQARVNDSYRLADVVSWAHRDHSFKFGLDYNYVTAANLTEDSLNGVFLFPTDLPFNSADPRTYPERLQIRVGGAQEFTLINHNTSLFAQDNWKVTPKLTLNLGLRYDDETISDDQNNLSPRLGFAYDPKGEGKTVIRGGYGHFYQNTPFELITAFRTAGPFSSSFVRNFPLNAADPGPRAGRLPTDPTLANGPTVNRELIASLVGSGTLLGNPTPVVDNSTRRMPYVRSVSFGFQHQLVSNLAVTADYIHQSGVDQLMTINLNPGLRASTLSTGAISRRFSTLGAVVENSEVPVDTSLFAGQNFSTLGVSTVTTRVNEGETKYDALQLSLDKRFSRGFQFKTSYTLSRGRGNTSGDGTPTANFQTQDNLNLDLNEGPTNFDRRHNFVFSGVWRVPKTRGFIVSTIIRALSGTPFTLQDPRVDPDRNGILFDPLPSGTFNATRTFPNGETLNFDVENQGGRNGARLPGFFSVDLRLAYKFNFTERVNAGFTFEAFNLTNRTNYDELAITGDRSSVNFLIPLGAKPMRTLQLGFRLGF